MPMIELRRLLAEARQAGEHKFDLIFRTKASATARWVQAALTRGFMPARCPS